MKHRKVFKTKEIKFSDVEHLKERISKETPQSGVKN